MTALIFSTHIPVAYIFFPLRSCQNVCQSRYHSYPAVFLFAWKIFTPVSWQVINKSFDGKENSLSLCLLVVFAGIPLLFVTFLLTLFQINLFLRCCFFLFILFDNLWKLMSYQNTLQSFFINQSVSMNPCQMNTSSCGLVFSMINLAQRLKENVCLCFFNWHLNLPIDVDQCARFCLSYSCSS